MKLSLIQILVVVAKIQKKILKIEVENGSISMENKNGLIDPKYINESYLYRNVKISKYKREFS